MKKVFMTMAVLAIAGAVQASEGTANSTAATSLTPVSSTMSTVCGSNWEDCRQLVEAKDDAAEFLATNGDVRSAKLQNAFNLLRQANVNLQASDLQLAEGLLALN